MKKFISKIVILAGILFLCVSFAACSPGKSAYEIWLNQGNTGTVTDFLESLKGPSGQDGKNGKDGVPGQDGKDGGGEIGIYDLFEAYLDIYPESTFEEFLHSFLVVDNYDTEYAAAKGIRSVVSIWSEFEGRTRSTRPPYTYTYYTYYLAGAGVVYRQTGGDLYIITNYHVVYDYESYESASGGTNKFALGIFVYSYGLGPSYDSAASSYGFAASAPAQYIGGSASKDIAVLKVGASDLPGYVTTAEIADSNNITLAERVVAVGNPLSEGISVTSGVVSVDSEEISMSRIDASSGSVTMRVIRTDAAINSGNSGGGLFNIRGELVGIVNAKTVEDGVENMGYAIPANVAAGIADCVIDNSGKCSLGITVTVSATEISYNGVTNRIEISETVAVDSVTAGGLAHGGGLQAGDILVSASLVRGGAPVGSLNISRLFHLPDFLYKARSGDVLTVTVMRGGDNVPLQMTVGSANFVAV